MSISTSSKVAGSALANPEEALRLLVAAGVSTLIAAELCPVAYKSGTKGFEADGKISVEGRRYKVQVRAFLVGSKLDPKMLPVAGVAQAAKALGEDFAEDLQAHVFPKHTGFYAGGKGTISGQRYQVNVNVYEA